MQSINTFSTYGMSLKISILIDGYFILDSAGGAVFPGCVVLQEVIRCRVEVSKINQ